MRGTQYVPCKYWPNCIYLICSPAPSTSEKLNVFIAGSWMGTNFNHETLPTTTFVGSLVKKVEPFITEWPPLVFYGRFISIFFLRWVFLESLSFSFIVDKKQNRGFFWIRVWLNFDTLKLWPQCQLRYKLLPTIKAW